jgi:hypothetical protein
MIISWGMKWALCLARVGEVICLQGLVVKHAGMRPIARIILNWILECSEMVWTGCIWLRLGQVAGCLIMGITFLYILRIFEKRGIISLSRSSLLHEEFKKVQTKPLGLSIRGF